MESSGVHMEYGGDRQDLQNDSQEFRHVYPLQYMLVVSILNMWASISFVSVYIFCNVSDSCRVFAIGIQL